MTERRATVWIGDRRVGALRESERRMHLTYDERWKRDGFPISIHLPIRSGELDAHDFFAGLLPEAHARRRVLREHRLADDDDFGILLAIGRDCAGALIILPDEHTPTGDAPPVPLSAEDFTILVDSHGTALPRDAEAQRFSLAGAQDKVAVIIDADRMWLPSYAHPSTHILKFETHKNLCLAEYLGHDLAARMGLPVAPTTYHRDTGPDATPYLLVERYDRAVDPTGRRGRLHQEDMTQALGFSTAQKYEEEGGPTLPAIAELIRSRAADPIRDIARLIDWQLFNYFIGNYDAHAKNLALLYAAGESIPRLAPFYDLVCIEFLHRLGIRYARKMAFHIATKSIPEEIGREDWRLFAKAMAVTPKHLFDRLRTMAERLPTEASNAHAAFATEFADNPSLDRFDESIRDRSRWTLAVLGAA